MKTSPGRPLLFVALILLAAACAAATNAYYNKDKPHHTPEGFRNNYIGVLDPKGFWTWQAQRIRAGLPKPPANHYQFPHVKPDVAWLKANRTETTATWIGHATVLVQVSGVNILTDPHFGDRASPVGFAGPKRLVPAGIAFDDLPHIDAVLISHNHYDHLDIGTVKRLAAQAGGPPKFFVGLGLKAWFAGLDIDNVTEMDWWDKSSYMGLEFNFTPVQHWSKRTLTDANQTLWGGWLVKSPRFGFFFAGDTGYSKDFAEIGKRYGGVDLGLIPIGAYAPRWFMHDQHVDPAQSVMIHRDVHAKKSIGIHWGTFELTDESLDEPPKKLVEEAKKAGLAPDEFVALTHGGMLRFPATP
jgi:L-ascorbate metabolism protein UlaG (beta-lactamase superfamily)